MKLVQVLKLCVCGAFIATIVTGAIFMVRSTADEQGGKKMKAHEESLGHDDKAVFPEEQKHVDEPKPVEEKEEEDGQRQNDDEQANVAQPKAHPKDIGQQRMIPMMPAPVVAVAQSTTTNRPTTSTSPVTVESKVLMELKGTTSVTPPSIHIFYYPWYGNPANNGGKWLHWNHRYLTNWNPADKKAYPTGAHSPPEDIASVYYPSLGPYSSWDAAVIERHMKWMSSAGIDVVVCSWYPKGKSDAEADNAWDPLIPALLNATDQAKMKMTFHLEPYEGRSAASVRQDISYLLEQYGTHPALYRRRRTNAASADVKAAVSAKELPLFYVYDSYRIKPDQWATVLRSNGTETIRGTGLDALLIGLYVDKGDEQRLVDGGFDGLYTYFAADGFSHGSTMENWPTLSAFCARNQLLFVPSVGPGYNDTRVRPWNEANARDRKKGEYYREHFKMAHTSKADIVSITSFNEWHEGTQIEPAVPFEPTKNGTSIHGHHVEYAQYSGGPEQYLQITREMIQQYFTAHHENIPAKIARIV